VLIFLYWSIVVPWAIMSCCTLGHGSRFNILQYRRNKNLFCFRSIPRNNWVKTRQKMDPAAV